MVDFNLGFNFDFGDSCCKQSVLLLLTGSFFLLLCILFVVRKYDSPGTDLIAVYSNFYFVLCLRGMLGVCMGGGPYVRVRCLKKCLRVRNACVVFV